MRSSHVRPREESEPGKAETRFLCQRCGACCRWPGHVWLTETDIQRLAARSGMGERDWIERFAELTRNRAGLSLREQADGTCVFFLEGRCGVYEDRPAQCRDFPARWVVSGPCPGREPKTGSGNP